MMQRLYTGSRNNTNEGVVWIFSGECIPENTFYQYCATTKCFFLSRQKLITLHKGEINFHDRFGVVIEKDGDGYFAHIPAAQGCYAQGDTYEEVVANIQEVLHLILEEDGADRSMRYIERIENITSE